MTDNTASGDSTTTPLRVVVVAADDDQTSVREGIAIMLDVLPDIQVVGTAADGEHALGLVAEHHPDAILLDLNMSLLDGIETTHRITAEHPDMAVVVLTTYADDQSILDTLRAGARGCLIKDADRTDITRTLHAAASGFTVLAPHVRARLFGAAMHHAPAPAMPLPDGLTRREGEILTMIARGMTNAEIASALFLSSNTVKTHIRRIFAKTGSRDRVAATQYVHRHH